MDCRSKPDALGPDIACATGTLASMLKKRWTFVKLASRRLLFSNIDARGYMPPILPLSKKMHCNEHVTHHYGAILQALFDSGRSGHSCLH
jgi:hypothetical protein